MAYHDRKREDGTNGVVLVSRGLRKLGNGFGRDDAGGRRGKGEHVRRAKAPVPRQHNGSDHKNGVDPCDQRQLPP